MVLVPGVQRVFQIQAGAGFVTHGKLKGDQQDAALV